MVLWFMRRKYVNDPTLFLHFCARDHPSFEEDLVLHLNKLEFLSCNNGLYQVLLKSARCFIFKDYFQSTTVKIISSLQGSYGPSRPLGTIIYTRFNLHYVRKLSCRSELFWLSDLENKNFQWPHPIFEFLWLSPLGRKAGPSFRHFFYSLPPSLIEIGQLV
jgi:hypothetical protein